MRHIRLLSIVISLSFILGGCDGTVKRQGGASGRILPNVTGGAGELLVVMDNFNWENAAGEALRDILLSEVPALPQSEPMYEITQITAASFDGVFTFHRTIIIVTINPSLTDSKVIYGKDEWASPQIVVELRAPDTQELIKLINDNHDRILAYLTQNERQRLMNLYKSSKDGELENRILKDHHVSVTFPRGYNLDFSNKDYSSVSIETPDFSQVVQIYEYPAKDSSALSTENLLKMRDKFTEKYVRGPGDSSYMVVATLLPPVAYDLKIGNQNMVEIRGLWELKKGFMGGPFISHAIYDKANNRVIVTDGYLYYPNQKKRIKMRQIEAVVYSMKLL